MKEYLLALILVLGVGTVGVAQATGTGGYLGVDAVSESSKLTDNVFGGVFSGTADATTLRVKGGTHISNNFDLEVQFILPRTGSYTALTQFDVKNSILAVFAKPNVDAGPINVYGLFGFASVETDVTLLGSSFTEANSGFAYGIGIQFNATKDLSVSIDYTQYLKKDDLGGQLAGLGGDIKAIGVGVNYTFK
jgi:opacity protein-like surface antigen